jgi:predicted YcjX-like family ATPase
MLIVIYLLIDLPFLSSSFVYFSEKPVKIVQPMRASKTFEWTNRERRSHYRAARGGGKFGGLV